MNENFTLYLKRNLFVFLLIAVNVLIFLLLSLFGDPGDPNKMISYGAEFHPLTLSGQYWRMFTAMFLHFDIAHLATNMLSLFAIGSVIESAFGRARFLLIYFGSGLGGGLASTFYHSFKNDMAVCAGASGAIFGLAGALICLALFKKTEAYGISSKRVLPSILISVIASSSTSTDNAAHVGGLLAGFLIAFLLSGKFFRKS